MLQELRDKAKSFVSYFLLIVLVFSFGIWGIGDIFRNNAAKDWVAKVADTKISPLLLNREFDNQMSQMRGLLGPDFTKAKAREMGLLERALNKLVTITALNMEVNKLGLSVPREQIVRTLEQTPQLRNKDGSFNAKLFQTMISQQGFSEAGFIDSQKQIMARNMLIRGLGAAVLAPDAVVNDMVAAAAQKRVAELVRVSADGIPDATATPDDLKKFYEGNKANYQSPEVRSFRILNLSPADVAKDVLVSDEDVKKAYDEHKSAFNQPETRDVVQVVAADEEKAKALLESAKKDLNAAAKAAGLEAVKLDHSTRKDLPGELADAVFKAEANTVGGPVKTDFGWHVFVVKKINEGKTQSFDEAKASVRTQLQSDKAAEVMVQTANKIDDMLAGGKKIDDIANSLGLKAQNFENRDRNGIQGGMLDGKEGGDKVPYPDDTLRAAFQYNEGDVSPLIERKEGGYVVVEVVKVTPQHALDYAAVETRVKTDWQTQQKAKKAAELAQDISKQLKEGKTLAAVAGRGVHTTTSPAVAIDDTKQKDVPREALAPLFNMKKGEAAVVSTGEGEIVVRVKEIVNADEKELANRKAAMKNRMSQEWTNTMIDELTHALRDVYPVEVDEKGLNRMVSDTSS